MKLTIFYDGFCPLCRTEMNHLKRLDSKHLIAFVDIQHAEFMQKYPHLEWRVLNARLHGLKENGDLISGLDVTYLAWQLVDKGWLFAPLRWPIIGWFADRLYNVFARHRYAISYLLTGQKRCQQCEYDKKN
jgi:predicted DCC family thiol-disulfide oxidoreductase YuxK